MSRAETDGAVVGEKDLFRQVASNLTKDQILSAKQDKLKEGEAKQAKTLMEQNLLKCRTVWRAFEKFIHKQVV